MSILAEISRILKEETGIYTYFIPSLWVNSDLENIKVNPAKCYSRIIDTILDQKQDNTNYNHSLSVIKKEIHQFSGDWTKDSTIYNFFIRLTTAYDHNNDGVSGGLPTDITLNQEGIRETGTFLKSIAILPYLKELGINTIHLLPITAIGSDGNKGDLGSPYAIKNYYEIDKTLADPLIYLPVEDQFKAFVEAAHILGIRIVLEFVFRTAAKDADWIKMHPDWFYWMDKKAEEKYTSPVFTEEELEKILKIPEGQGEYIPPPQYYKSFFKKPPKPDQIRLENGKYIATRNNEELVIPGAFSDWSPNDIQPPWDDVTYLRMYNYPYDKEENYNYIAYNTIRYYDPEFAKPENANKPLWTMIKNIIPHYQQEFGIDGVMIDMGHALPSELKQDMLQLARENDPDFAFISEDFSVTKVPRDEGYNAVVGHTWVVQYEDLQKIIDTAKEAPINFWGAPETHDTPRVAQKAGTAFSKLTWTLYNFLPNTIPYLQGGFELGETLPVNTGLNFTQEELDYYKDKKLPLFYKSSYNWLNEDNIIEFIKKIAQIREKYRDLITNPDPKTLEIPNSDNKNVLTFCRTSPNKRLLIVINTNLKLSEIVNINLEKNNCILEDHLSEKIFNVKENKLSLDLEPGEILIL